MPRLNPRNTHPFPSEAREARARESQAASPRGARDDGGDDPSVMDPYAGITAHRRETAVLAATATLDEIQRVQSKTRDKDGRIRRGKFIGAVLGMRYEGHTPKEIAELLGCSHQQVTYALTQIRRDADLDAQVRRLNAIAVPLAMDNAVRGVMNGDKDYTLRVLDGAGVFRTHKSIQGEIKQTITSLSVVLEMPRHLVGQPLPLPRAGQIVGAPTVHTGLPSAQCLEGIVIEPPAPIVPREHDLKE